MTARKRAYRNEQEKARSIARRGSTIPRHPGQGEDARDKQEHPKKQEEMSYIPSRGGLRYDRDMGCRVPALRGMEKVADAHQRRAYDQARGSYYRAVAGR